MKKCILFFTILLFYFVISWSVAPQVGAQSLPEESPSKITLQPIEIIAFIREGCKHCSDEETFLAELIKQRNTVKVTYLHLEIPEQKKRWEEFTEKIGVSKVTPLTIIGDQLIIGFDSGSTTGRDIENLLEKTILEGKTTDLSAVRYSDSSKINAACPEDGSAPCLIEESSQFITLPLIGRINTNDYPLALLSAILGFIDGFNPCAMWVLVTFLLILIQIGSRKKMFLFAGTFILAETIMYYLILTVWFKTWDFVQLDRVVTPIVGIVAIGAGIFFLREWREKELACKITNTSQRYTTRKKIEQLASSKFSIFTVLGILGIAFSVNIIEFACSIGIPQTFTKILDMNNLGFFRSQALIGIYIFFYMIDDFIVFAIGLYSADKLSITTKYSKLSNLVGGILMICLGLILLFKPSLFIL